MKRQIRKLLVICLPLFASFTLSAQSFKEVDVVFLYDDVIVGAEGLAGDSLYAMLSRYVEEPLRLVPVSMSQTDDQDWALLKDASAIIVGETAEWDTTSPLATELYSLVTTKPILCLSPQFGAVATLNDETGFPGASNFETMKVEARQVKTTYNQTRHIFFDDVLGDNDGVISVFDSSSEGILYPALVNEWGAEMSFDVYGKAAQPAASYDGDYAAQGILLRVRSSHFLYLGIPQQEMYHLTPAGKNLVRNSIAYLTAPDNSDKMRKPHIEGITIERNEPTADFMAELSSGAANYVIPANSDYFQINVLNIEALHGCYWRYKYEEDGRYWEIHIEYDDQQMDYRIYGVSDNPLSVASVAADGEKASLFDLQGRPVAHPAEGQLLIRR